MHEQPFHRGLIGMVHAPSSAAIPPPSAYAFTSVRASRRSAARRACCPSACVRAGLGARYGRDAGLPSCDGLGESDGRSGRLIELSRAGAGTGDGGREDTPGSDKGDGERDEGGSEAGGEFGDPSASPASSSCAKSSSASLPSSLL